MILEFLTFLYRRRRYREVSELIIPLITKESQARLDKTLTDAHEKAIAAGATPEQVRERFNQPMIDRANELLSKENAQRIRQWCDAILDEEPR